MRATLVRSHGANLTTSGIRAYPDPSTERRWRKFLQATGWASHFVSPEYFLDPKVSKKASFAILVEHGGDIVACLTGCHEKSQIISGLQTHPQLVILDIPDRYLVEKCLLVSLLEEAKRTSFITVYSWSEIRAFEDMKFWSRTCNSTYVLNLSSSEDTLFQNLDGKRRNGIRNAIKSGLDVKGADFQDLPKFCEVLKTTHKRLGLTPPPLIDDILRPETNRKLFVAYFRGQCVAGTILRYQRGGLAEYSENASLPEFWRLRPNDLLLWEAIKWAKRIGCTALNFGGHNLFKKEFGGTLHPIFRISLDTSFLRWRHARDYLEMLARRTAKSFISHSMPRMSCPVGLRNCLKGSSPGLIRNFCRCP